MAGERGFLLVLSAPSGAGKSTLARWLLRLEEGVGLSVSVTTRPPRPGEEDGVHYHFVSHAEFDQRLAAGEFVEWAEVFGNRYGTSRLLIQGMLEEGLVVVLDIDWQGARQVRSCFPAADVVTVFIVPPSPEALRQRLQGRGQDSEEVIAGRMAKANQEMSHWAEYDYLVVNEDLAKAQGDLAAILRGERLRCHRLGGSGQQLLAKFGEMRV